MKSRTPGQIEPRIRAAPGTYALVLRCRSAATVTVGRLGRVRIAPGFYVYIGSAFGPGGVQARVARHCRRSRVRHWHIDYLRPHLTLIGAWYRLASEPLEHTWATACGNTLAMVPVDGFGCSDCRCRSHLFWTECEPDLGRVLGPAGAGIRYAASLDRD